MKLLEMCFDIDISNDFASYSKPYDYWSLDLQGNYLFLHYRKDIAQMDETTIESHIPYIYKNSWSDKPMFIPYEELELYLTIEVEIDGSILYEFSNKYPLVCVRGTCDGRCSKKNTDFYCFRDVPCTDGRPDWNVYAAKYPNFYDLLFDVANFIGVCPNTDSLIVMFDYPPYEYDRELSFDYAFAMKIEGNKANIINDCTKIKVLYKDYNSKYPTKDRKIEEAISRPETGYIFKF